MNNNKKHWSYSLLALAFSSVFLTGCGTESTSVPAQESTPTNTQTKTNDPYPTTYERLASEPTLIKNVTLYDGIGGVFEDTQILLQDGKIQGIGDDIALPDEYVEIDGTGKFVTPGIIDTHSHLGVYPSPDTRSHADGNEATSPVTAEVWAEHSVWPQDPGFGRALAGGVTSLQILPGSANLFGGRSVVLKNLPDRTMQDMKFPDAPYGIKMACGENPKRVYGRKGGPSTRMANVAGYRSAWIDAAEYKADWDAYEEAIAAGEDATAPRRDLNNETLKGVLDGDIIVHMHCYRADEMTVMMDVMQEFDYQIGSFHHAVEGYKIADKLAQNKVCASMWADWWGFKMEAYDGIRENVAMVHQAGACAVVHSDSDIGIQRLNQEAAKAWADGRRVGIDIPKADAWSWLTSNAAKSLGIFDQTGSLEVGKNADVVLWTAEPFSTYSQAEKVFIDGGLAFDRTQPDTWPVSDFELGQVGAGDNK